MKCKQAKELLLSACFRVSDNLEMSWMSSVSIKANGDTLIHSRYLNDTSELARECKVFNFPESDMVEVEL